MSTLTIMSSIRNDPNCRSIHQIDQEDLEEEEEERALAVAVAVELALVSRAINKWVAINRRRLYRAPITRP